MEDQPSVPKHRKTTPSLSDDFVRVLEKAKAHLSPLPFSDEEIYAKLERHEDREDRVDLVVYEILIDYYKMKANLKEDLANDMKNVMHYDKKNRREIVLQEMWKESKTQSIPSNLEPAGTECIIQKTMMEDVDVLREIFPEDDPNYLYDKLEQNEDDPNRVDKVTKEILDHKLAEKIDRSIAKEILIKAFLEQFPNPLQTFCNEKEQMNENYKAHALTQLSTDFRNVRKWYIRQVLENHNHHYYGALKELQRKIKDLPDISEKLLKITRPFGKETKMPDDRDEFFYHEKFFVDNEQEIKGIKTPSEVFLGGQSNKRLETESKEKRRERKRRTSDTRGRGTPDTSSASSDVRGRGTPDTSSASSDVRGRGTPDTSSASSDVRGRGTPDTSSASSDVRGRGTPDTSSASSDVRGRGTPDTGFSSTSSQSLDFIEVVDSEDKELERAVHASLMEIESTQHTLNSEMESGSSLEEILQKFRETAVNSNERTELIIFRKKLLESTFMGMARPTFKLNAKIYVKFSGEIGQDYGGPRREFFRLAMKELSMSPLFEGEEGKRIFAHNIKLLEENKYTTAGRLVALALISSGRARAPFFT